MDDVFDSPERLVALAQAVQDQFVQVPGNAFPGYQLRMDDDFSAQLDAFFRLHIRGLLRQQTQPAHGIALVPSDLATQPT